MRSTKLPSWSRRLTGLDPVPVPGHVFSVERDRLRYGWFSREGDDLEFREYHSEELGERAFLDGPLGGPVREPDRFGRSLDGLLSRISQVPESASLVVPDRWLRVVFTDQEKVPRGTDRDSILRFKLRRLVPFRVDELRVAAVGVPSFESRTAEDRLIVGFGVEALLSQLEAGLEQRGVRIGHLSNESLAVVSALRPLLKGDLGAVVYVSRDAYSVIVVHDGQPVMHRFKTLSDVAETRSLLIPRDLGLTCTYLRQEMKGRRLGELILIAPGTEEPSWKGWLEEAFEHPVRVFGEEWPELPGTVTGVPSWESLALVGAASRGIS